MATLLFFIFITIAGLNRPGPCQARATSGRNTFSSPSYSKPRVQTAAILSTNPALSPANPWNHFQQANVHCAYCNSAYSMPGYNLPVEVHDPWLFFPFHRLYLYFYERILGRLITDDTFAIPFWNRDSPTAAPEMYVNPSSPLYDPLRDEVHPPPTIIDPNYNDTDTLNTVNLTERNLHTTYRQMVSTTTAELLYGPLYVAGDKPSPGAGSIESMPHNAVHSWTGDRKHAKERPGGILGHSTQPDGSRCSTHTTRTLTGCGIFGRQSSLAKTEGGFSDDDWLDAWFLFWDENLSLVRARRRGLGIRIKMLNAMGWLQAWQAGPKRVEKPEATEEVSLPVRLESPVTVEVKMLRVMRSEEEKEREEEVLVVDDIESMKSEKVKFDVYVNACPGNEEGIGPESAHFAGSSVRLGMRLGRRIEMMRTRLRLGIGELLTVERD